MTGGHSNKAFQEFLLLGQWERMLILDGVGNPTQEIGVGHGPSQSMGELWDRKGEGA